MIGYSAMEDYDGKYKIKNREIACYSKTKMKKLFPDGNFMVIGETLPGNKKERIDTVELGGIKFRISEADGHSPIFFRTVGYMSNGSGEYIALLRRNYLLLWIFLAVLAAAITAVLILPKDEGGGILPPDYEHIQDDPHAQTETHDDEPDDRMILTLPSGKMEFDMKSGIGVNPGETGRAKIILTVDKTDYEIWTDVFTVNADGSCPDLMLDFTKVHVELKSGRYLGKMIFTAPSGAETTLPMLIIIRDTYGGSATVDYSPYVTVERAAGNITMKYKHGLDASHDCVLQLILDNGGKEYLLSQSGVLHPGQTLTVMMLNSEMTSRLTTGIYHGRLRVNFYNSENELNNINTDIEVTITVQ